MKRNWTPAPPPEYALGAPVNREPLRGKNADDIAIPNRPGWFRRPNGDAYYVEPPFIIIPPRVPT